MMLYYYTILFLVGVIICSASIQVVYLVRHINDNYTYLNISKLFYNEVYLKPVSEIILKNNMELLIALIENNRAHSKLYYAKSVFPSKDKFDKSWSTMVYLLTLQNNII